MKITVPGKGGIVIDPDGTKHMCPHFSLHKCYSIEISWDDIFSPNNQGDLDIILPATGTATFFTEDGNVLEVRNVTINWIDLNGVNVDSLNQKINLSSSESIIIN